MAEFLNEDDLSRLAPASALQFRSPIPTRPISNGEFMPGAQTRAQKEVEARIVAPT